ncbi:YncE family protein [Thermoanaerobacter sp. CM-CNRG TB177]|uniref:YncE family protein n=1 Tax=Thermoanaerobacter sp. CM-CNRG TB177 TaxID=2800659 RepID=UPI001BDDDA59|nr:YncE family protein [Thermoanaerobacter sp. CM-CNRG TB177]MBT1279526.1 YncE family protein [Thermoanaerobacter sp. CM-CNRG TB177]
MHIYIADMGEDIIERVNLETNHRDFAKINSYNNKHLPLNIYSKYLCGPHRLILDKHRQKLYSLNAYDNSISIINLENFTLEISLYVGNYPNNGVIYKDCILVVNGDSDAISIFDIEEKKVIGQVKVGSFPQDIVYNEKYNLIFVSNMNSDEILLIDPYSYKIVEFIGAGARPIGMTFSEDWDYLYVVESYFETGINGKISIIDLQNFKVIDEIGVGKVPTMVRKKENFLYVLNSYSNTLCKIDLFTKHKKEVVCGNAPAYLTVLDKFAYVSSVEENKVNIIDIEEMRIVNFIKTRKEPQGLVIDP